MHFTCSRFEQVDQIPNLVTSVAFGLGGDVITGDVSGRIFVWIKDSSDAFVVDRMASENLRHAHEVSRYIPAHFPNPESWDWRSFNPGISGL